MAVTNFRAEDFPSGKKRKEQNNEPRKDNLILQGEVDKAVRDENEGNKFAKEFGAKVDEAEKTLNEEISHTEVPLDEQPEPPKRRRSTATTKAAKAAAEHIEDEVEKSATTESGTKPSE
jgi:hypothetical protein